MMGELDTVWTALNERVFYVRCPFCTAAVNWAESAHMTQPAYVEGRAAAYGKQALAVHLDNCRGGLYA